MMQTKRATRIGMGIVIAVCLGAAGGISRAADSSPAISAGDEFRLLTDGPGKGAQGRPDVAFGNQVYLAVWREGWPGEGGNARIFAARISPEGKVLDPKGIEVAPSREGIQERPRVAFAAGAAGGQAAPVFLVVWQDMRNGKDLDILAARVAPDGKVLDNPPLAIAAAPRTQALPDVASDGSSFLVVWQGVQGEETGYRGFAAPVGADGKVGAAVETGATPQPRVAWGGTNYLAVAGGAGFWMGAVSGFLLGPDGKPVSKKIDVIGGTKEACFSVAASPGKGWLVVSHRSPPDPWGWGGPGAMRTALVTAGGALDSSMPGKEPSGNWNKLANWLDAGGRERQTWPWGQSAGVWDGRHFVVVWPRQHITGEKKSSFENSDLMAARVDGWKPMDNPGVPVAATPAEERFPALAGGQPGRVMLVYETQSAQDGGCFTAARLLTIRGD